jgi:hypothetical protein
MAIFISTIYLSTGQAIKFSRHSLNFIAFQNCVLQRDRVLERRVLEKEYCINKTRSYQIKRSFSDCSSKKKLCIQKGWIVPRSSEVWIFSKESSLVTIAESTKIKNWKAIRMPNNGTWIGCWLAGLRRVGTLFENKMKKTRNAESEIAWGEA